MRCEGFRVTPRDREIVRWIGRHRFVTASQVAERFGVGRSQCYARLTGLARLGLLRHERLLHGQPGIYLGTRSGLDLAGVALPAAMVDLRTYTHDLEVASLVTWLEQEADGGTTVWTEREARSIDAPVGRVAREYRPKFAVPLERAQLSLTTPRPARVHFPDAVLCGPDCEATAVELELTAKGRSRLRRILRAYLAARHLTRVLYFTPCSRVDDLLRSEITELRAEDLIEVRSWSLRGSSAALTWPVGAAPSSARPAA